MPLRMAVLPLLRLRSAQTFHGNGALSSSTDGSVCFGVCSRVTKLSVPIGILISSDGPYSVVSSSMLGGALLAIDEVNASGLPVQLDPVLGNPAGQLARYVSLAEE